MQSPENLMQVVLIKTANKRFLKQNQRLPLLRMFYGLAYGGEHWGRTIRYNVLENVEMQSKIPLNAILQNYHLNVADCVNKPLLDRPETCS